MALLFAMAGPAFALPGKFSFTPCIYFDGQPYSSRKVADLPARNWHNLQSYDMLVGITNGVEGQLAVAEAGPGNPAYNGGRWDEVTATWNAGATPVLIKSFGQLMQRVADGSLTIDHSNPQFLECPLVPVK
ncbi:MAG: hypothetical protein WAM81_05735 [Acidimicrobiia bacterium]